MKRVLLSAALLASLGATTALASEKCSVPQADWQPQTALQEKLESDGWTIKRIKIDDGCYEVYGTDSKGQRMETYFDPQTFAVVHSETQD